jgi:hypothetical protein
MTHIQSKNSLFAVAETLRFLAVSVSDFGATRGARARPVFGTECRLFACVTGLVTSSNGDLAVPTLLGLNAVPTDVLRSLVSFDPDSSETGCVTSQEVGLYLIVETEWKDAASDGKEYRSVFDKLTSGAPPEPNSVDWLFLYIGPPIKKATEKSRSLLQPGIFCEWQDDTKLAASTRSLTDPNSGLSVEIFSSTTQRTEIQYSFH